ncbi:MAG TPA: HEAT repeat domain-containing protein, partial [Polyangiales bacterium]|nr:HEAT repeat domain-containing protein [Polyangiales bacterium]
VVGTYDERTQLCGQERTLLAPRAVDPKTLSLKSVLLNRAAERAVQAQLTATAVAPVASPPPLLHALRAISASSASADIAQSSAAVSDGDLASAWVEGRGLGGRFEFVTLRWAAPERAIRAIAVVLAKEDASAHARPHVLSLLGDQGAHLVATLPDDAVPGQRYWITPPEPLAWTCLSVSVDALAPGAIDAKSHTALAEVEAYTDLDFAGGLDTLVAELAQPGPRGDDATQLLASARGDVVAALVAIWPHLSTLGKRRAMRVLFGSRTPDPRANEILRNAMRDPDPEVSEHGIELARGKIDGGPALLLELAADATPQGDHAALAFAHSAEPAAFEKLLPLLFDKRGTERPVLRDALALAYRASGTNGRDIATHWLATSPPVAAEAALALALASAPESRETAASIFRASRAASREFADQWRLVECAAALDDEADGDAWLTGLVRESDTWMLRMAALSALQARRSTATVGEAKRALTDDYPRVRANALKVLSSNSPDIELLSRYARDDKWFLVRAAAIESLPNLPNAQAVMVAATGDRTPAVRAVAIHALQRAGVASAWPRIQKLLENAEEYPEVLAEGIAFAKALCVVAAAPSLHAVVERGLQPDAWAPD